jgi:hypothetical protein
LTDFVRRLLEPALSGVNAPIALVDVFLHISHVVVFKVPALLLLGVGGLVLVLQRLGMNFRARAQVLFRVREQIVRASTHEVRAADLRIGDLELGGLSVHAVDHLLAHELLCLGCQWPNGQRMLLIELTKQLALLCRHLRC